MGKGARLRRLRTQGPPRDRVDTGDVIFTWEPDGAIQVLVDLGDRVGSRTVRAAAPLRLDRPQGDAAEDASLGAAAAWGMPDYVFRPAIVRTGSGPKQVGDLIVVAGGIGLMLQVKSRVEPTTDAAKEERWVRKQATKAVHQANGSLRLLQRLAPSHTHLRERELEIRYEAVERWVTVVIIDHARPSLGLDLGSSLADSTHPAVALTRRDWEFLWEQLKSGVAVARYVTRVATDEFQVGLGQEAARYYRLAAEDAAAPSRPRLDSSGFYGVPGVLAGPALQAEPAGHQSPAQYAVTRLLLEDIAVSDMSGPVGVSRESLEWMRIRMLWAFDSLPVHVRERIGADVQA